MATWDLEAISSALGVPIRQRKRGVFGLELTHPKIGTRLKVELAPAVDALRLWCDRMDAGHLTVLGRVDLLTIATVAINAEEGRVQFSTGHHPATQLEVAADATFLVTVGERAISMSEPGREDDRVVQLVGRLARPHYSEATGKPFFTAGLAEYRDGATAPTWHNIKAFGGVARAAQHLERGAWVRLTGKPQVDRYQKDGQGVSRPVILLVHIEAAG